jgi:hypothetical protein
MRKYEFSKKAHFAVFVFCVFLQKVVIKVTLFLGDLRITGTNFFVAHLPAGIQKTGKFPLTVLRFLHIFEFFCVRKGLFWHFRDFSWLMAHKKFLASRRTNFVVNDAQT